MEGGEISSEIASLAGRSMRPRASTQTSCRSASTVRQSLAPTASQEVASARRRNACYNDHIISDSLRLFQLR